jgi:hypothetical protein
VQRAGPVVKYPSLHVGWQVEPATSSAEQLPFPPFIGGASTLQGGAAHCPFVKTPFVQLEFFEMKYPWLQTGWHIVPSGRPFTPTMANHSYLVPRVVGGS